MKRTGLVMIFMSVLAGCDRLDNYAECRTFTKYQVRKQQSSDASIVNNLYQFCRKKGVDAVKERWENVLALRGTQPCT